MNREYFEVFGSYFTRKLLSKGFLVVLIANIGYAIGKCISVIVGGKFKNFKFICHIISGKKVIHDVWMM
jgi:hypothetical protein